jgi:hypothetical protein
MTIPVSIVPMVSIGFAIMAGQWVFCILTLAEQRRPVALLKGRWRRGVVPLDVIRHVQSPEIPVETIGYPASGTQ